MNAYPLESLLSVRVFREEEAKRGVQTAQEALRLAHEAALQRRREYEEYKRWRAEEEDRRWEALFRTRVKMSGLERFKAGLAALAAGEQSKLEAVSEAEQEEQRSEKRLAQAKTEASNARKNTAKIETHKELWTEEAKKEAERAEELELEEFHPVSFFGAAGEDL